MADETKLNAESTAEVTTESTADATNNTAPQKDTTDYKALYEKLKASHDKTSSDVARLKKELTERSTKEENERRENEERIRGIMEENERLRTNERIGNYSTNLMSWGMDADNAKDLASKLPDGASEDFFAAVKTFIENERTRIRAEALNAQPKPTMGMSISSADIEKAKDDKLRKAFGFKD